MLTKLKFQILPDNQTRLGLLCGPINSTLKQIEDALNIKISNRGNNVKLKGDKINIDAGKVVIENLYNKSIDGDIILGPGGGDVLPDGDNTRNFGSASKRWANIYTGDLHLKNDRGDWTIVEEEDFLCVIHNKTGKKFKMNLIPLEDDE